MSNSFWILAGVLVAAAAIISLCERHNRRRKRIRFEHRESATTGQLATFFPSIPRDTVEEALGIISIAADVPVGMLRPHDRFDKELAPVRGWEFDDGLAQLEWALKDRAQSKEAMNDLPRMETVADFVRAYHQLGLTVGD